MWGLMQGEGAAENPAEVLSEASWGLVGQAGSSGHTSGPWERRGNCTANLARSSYAECAACSLKQSLPVSSVQVSCKEPHLPLHQIREI